MAVKPVSRAEVKLLLACCAFSYLVLLLNSDKLAVLKTTTTLLCAPVSELKSLNSLSR
jgi:hypothetical protein